MNRGTLLNIESTLKGAGFIKIEQQSFLDSDGRAGAAIGGIFSSLDEIRDMCDENEVYIYSLEMITNTAGETIYRMVYACRELKLPKNALAMLKKLNTDGSVPMGILPLATVSQLQTGASALQLYPTFP